MDKPFDFMKKVHRMEFIEKFAAESIYDVAEIYKASTNPVAINAPIMYKV